MMKENIFPPSQRFGRLWQSQRRPAPLSASAKKTDQPFRADRYKEGVVQRNDSLFSSTGPAAAESVFSDSSDGESVSTTGLIVTPGGRRDQTAPSASASSLYSPLSLSSSLSSSAARVGAWERSGSGESRSGERSRPRPRRRGKCTRRQARRKTSKVLRKMVLSRLFFRIWRVSVSCLKRARVRGS